MTAAKASEVRILASDVLVVAKPGGFNDWAAYIGGVMGRNHDDEWKAVEEYGNKLPEHIARAIFQSSPWRDLDYRT